MALDIGGRPLRYLMRSAGYTTPVPFTQCRWVGGSSAFSRDAGRGLSCVVFKHYAAPGRTYPHLPNVLINENVKRDTATPYLGSPSRLAHIWIVEATQTFQGPPIIVTRCQICSRALNLTVFSKQNGCSNEWCVLGLLGTRKMRGSPLLDCESPKTCASGATFR
jgi:hypothetical protein